MVKLEDVLEDIIITDAAGFDQEEFENKIKTEMPDYEVFASDLDDADPVNDIGNAIKRTVTGNHITDMQTAMWRTELEDLCMYVVAIKNK